MSTPYSWQCLVSPGTGCCRIAMSAAVTHSVAFCSILISVVGSAHDEPSISSLRPDFKHGLKQLLATTNVVVVSGGSDR